MKQTILNEPLYGQIEATSTILAHGLLVRLHLPDYEFDDIRQELIILGFRSASSYRSGDQIIGTFVTEKLKWACKDILRRYHSDRRKAYLYCDSDVCVRDEETGELASCFDSMPDSSPFTDIIAHAEIQSILELVTRDERQLLSLLYDGYSPRGASLLLGKKPWYGTMLLRQIQEKLRWVKN